MLTNDVRIDVMNRLGRALTALVETTLAVDENAPCIDPACTVGACDSAEEVSA